VIKGQMDLVPAASGAASRMFHRRLSAHQRVKWLSFIAIMSNYQELNLA
jgi:hypothetical protein